MIMTDLLKEGISQAPSLVVLVAVVFMFLRSMEKRDTAIKQFHDEHIAARTEGRDAIRDCSASNRELINCINRWKNQNPPRQ